MSHDFQLSKAWWPPVILGADFLKQRGLVLDFARMPVQSRTSKEQYEGNIPPKDREELTRDIQPIFEATQSTRTKFYAATVTNDTVCYTTL